MRRPLRGTARSRAAGRSARATRSRPWIGPDRNLDGYRWDETVVFLPHGGALAAGMAEDGVFEWNFLLWTRLTGWVPLDVGLLS